MAPSKDSVTKWYQDELVGIIGSRIVMVARKITGPLLVKGSGRHKANQVIGQIEARVWVEIPMRFVAEAKPPESK